MKAGALQHLSPASKMILLLAMMLVAVIFVSLFVGLLGFSLYGTIDFDPELLMSDIRLVKILQLFQSVFVFIIPSAFAAYLFFAAPLSGFHGDVRIRFNVLFISAIAILVSQYFIVWTGYVNSQMVLPESWEKISMWITQTEEEAIRITMKLTESNAGVGFVVNVIILALVPAIGEEWLFRGHLQRYFGDWTKSVHMAIFITSVLFATMHLQFMTFLPRFFLGMILGYLFYYGGNLWYSIIGHFANNFLALLLMRVNETETVVTNPMEMQQGFTFSVGVVFS